MMPPLSEQIRAAQSIVYQHMPPQHSWPLVNERLEAEGWINHENQIPFGACKLRGALVYASWLKQTQPGLVDVATATRGNFGQEKSSKRRRRAGIILTGVKVDREAYLAALNGAFEPARPA